jgi:hypothetical protein
VVGDKEAGKKKKLKRLQAVDVFHVQHKLERDF